MKILFIAPNYCNLYKDIELEIKRQGHDINTFIYKGTLKFDPYLQENSFHLIKYYFTKVNKTFDKYWKKEITNNVVLSEYYDILFVINGEIVGKYLIQHLCSINPKIRKIFYTWDTLNYYRFNRLFQYFDKCYSFDLNDCRRYKKLTLLPIYYIEESKEKEQEYKYDIMMIGTNHDSRYNLVKKILPIFHTKNIKYYIKIIDTCKNELQNINLRRNINLFLSRFKLSNPSIYINYKECKSFHEDNENYEIKSDEFIKPSVYRYISSVSRCILDTNRDSQSGLTARFMWALGNGKKIITTNKYALDYNFINKEDVLIIDKKNPQIPIDFLSEYYIRPNNPEILKYRIDNWVKIILNS